MQAGTVRNDMYLGIHGCQAQQLCGQQSASWISLFELRAKVQWLHLDCDTYGGHRLVLSLLEPFLAPGSVFPDSIEISASVLGFWSAPMKCTGRWRTCKESLYSGAVV